MVIGRLFFLWYRAYTRASYGSTCRFRPFGPREGYSLGEAQRLEPGPGRVRAEVWIDLRGASGMPGPSAAGSSRSSGWSLHNSGLEGINNTVTIIKRRAYGFRNDDHFFLKIRAAFRDDGRGTKKRRQGGMPNAPLALRNPFYFSRDEARRVGRYCIGRAGDREARPAAKAN